MGMIALGEKSWTISAGTIADAAELARVPIPMPSDRLTSGEFNYGRESWQTPAWERDERAAIRTTLLDFIIRPALFWLCGRQAAEGDLESNHAAQAQSGSRIESDGSSDASRFSTTANPGRRL